ncbi:MAG: hypothetical protein V2A34_02480 [Lentisphaerota bacterium]
MFKTIQARRGFILAEIVICLLLFLGLWPLLAAFGDAGYGRGPESDTTATNAMAAKIGADAFRLDYNSTNITAINGYTVTVTKTVMLINSSGSADSYTNVLILADPGIVGRFALLYNTGTSNSIGIASGGNWDSTALVVTPGNYCLIVSRATNKWGGIGATSAGWWPEKDTTATNAMATKFGAHSNLIDVMSASADVTNGSLVSITRPEMLLASGGSANGYTNTVTLADPTAVGRMAILYNSGTSNNLAVAASGNWASTALNLSPGNVAMIWSVATNKWAGR